MLAFREVQQLAAKQLMAKYSGRFTSKAGGVLELKAFGNSTTQGLAVASLTTGHEARDIRSEAAARAGIELENVDFRLYPTNVRRSTQHQFVAVLQDKAAPVDAGTPTCITWMDAGSLEGVPYRFSLDIGRDGRLASIAVEDGEVYLRG